MITPFISPPNYLHLKGPLFSEPPPAPEPSAFNVFSGYNWDNHFIRTSIVSGFYALAGVAAGRLIRSAFRPRVDFDPDAYVRSSRVAAVPMPIKRMTERNLGVRYTAPAITRSVPVRSASQIVKGEGRRMSRTARLTMIAERYLKGIGGVPDEVRAIIQFNDSSRLNAIYLETRLRELAEKRAPMTGREMALAIMEKRFRTTADAEVALDRIIKRKFPRREFPVIPAKAEILVRGNRAYADACSGCGTGISPQNDAAAVYAWGLGEALLYGTVRPSHLFPVVDRGRTVCRGAPGWAKYFPGQPRVEGPYDFTTERILRRGYRAFLEFLRDNTLPMPGGRPDRIAGI